MQKKALTHTHRAGSCSWQQVHRQTRCSHCKCVSSAFKNDPESDVKKKKLVIFLCVFLDYGKVAFREVRRG